MTDADFNLDLESYAAGEPVPLDPFAVALAAQALAIYEGDERPYNHDPDVHEGFAERARIAIGIYLNTKCPQPSHPRT